MHHIHFYFTKLASHYCFPHIFPLQYIDIATIKKTWKWSNGVSVCSYLGNRGFAAFVVTIQQLKSGASVCLEPTCDKPSWLDVMRKGTPLSVRSAAAAGSCRSTNRAVVPSGSSAVFKVSQGFIAVLPLWSCLTKVLLVRSAVEASLQFHGQGEIQKLPSLNPTLSYQW